MHNVLQAVVALVAIHYTNNFIDWINVLVLYVCYKRVTCVIINKTIPEMSDKIIDITSHNNHVCVVLFDDFCRFKYSTQFAKQKNKRV